MRIKRAILSVSDKVGIEELAKTLVALNIELISTGGTKKTLVDANIPVTDISEISKSPEAFGGRVKSLSFQVQSALLFDREKHKEEADNLGIEPIDLVVCNLYPFQKAAETGAEIEMLTEHIDIGGPAMIRAAAKNFKYVAVITKPEDYAEFIALITKHNGKTSYEYRRTLMARAFNHTADYDALIAQAMDAENGELSLRLAFEGGTVLRYGENAHQQALMYRQRGNNHSFRDMKILHGKEISYNNILDISAAVSAIKELTNEACVVVKHTNPCGFAQSYSQPDALRYAWQGDPVSAFGSVIAFNTKLLPETVVFFNLDHNDSAKRKFVEIIIAPEIDKEALYYLQQHKNLRVIEFDFYNSDSEHNLRFENGTLLRQDTDSMLYSKLETVTEHKIQTNIYQKIIEFGLTAVKNIKSNAIAIVRQKYGHIQLLGSGSGQPNRLISTELALSKARNVLTTEFDGDLSELEAYILTEKNNAVLVSDAFFPFADNIELAAKSGIKHIVQPGGSIRDKSVIKACNQLCISMIFTHVRHFRH